MQGQGAMGWLPPCREQGDREPELRSVWRGLPCADGPGMEGWGWGWQSWWDGVELGWEVRVWVWEGGRRAVGSPALAERQLQAT